MSEVIRAENLYKTYRMGDVEVPALRGVDLTIDQAEFVAVMGSSGSNSAWSMVRSTPRKAGTSTSPMR